MSNNYEFGNKNTNIVFRNNYIASSLRLNKILNLKP